MKTAKEYLAPNTIEKQVAMDVGWEIERRSDEKEIHYCADCGNWMRKYGIGGWRSRGRKIYGPYCWKCFQKYQEE